MVLHFGEKNLIAGFNVLVAPGARDKIYGLGLAARENDFFRAASIQEARHALARCLECTCGAIAQFMDSTMHVGIVVLVKTVEGVDYGARLLTRGSIVEINQLVPVDGLMQGGKIIAEFQPIRFRFIGGRGNSPSRLSRIGYEVHNL